MSPFQLSLEEWIARGGSETTWRQRARATWAEIRTGEHWHDCKPCKDVGCPNGDRLAPVVPS